MVLKKAGGGGGGGGRESLPLHSAAIACDLERLEAALLEGAEANATDAAGRTALHLAAPRDLLTNSTSLVRRLLAAGCDPTRQDAFGWTPLRYLDGVQVWGSRESRELAEMMLQAGADTRDLVTLREIVDSLSYDGFFPVDSLSYDERSDDEEDVGDGEIPEQMNDFPRLTLYWVSGGTGNCRYEEALHEAIELELLKTTRALLEAGVAACDGGRAPNQPTAPPLPLGESRNAHQQHLQADGGDGAPPEGRVEGTQETRRWCTRGGDHQAAESTALEMALQYESPEVIRNFPDRMWTSNELGDQWIPHYTQLHIAVMIGDIASADICLKRGARVRATCKGGLEPLQCAVSSKLLDDNSRPAVVRLLLENGASPVCQDENGNLALNRAASFGGKSVLEMLLENGGDLHATDRRGRGLLHFARDKATVRFLLDRGVNVDLTDELGRVSLHSAAELNHLTAVEALLPFYDAKIRDNDGITALHLAAGRGNASVVDLLVSRLADNEHIDVADNNGWTPLILSIALVDNTFFLFSQYYESRQIMKAKVYSIDEDTENKHVKCAAKLLDAGADPNLSDHLGRAPIHWAVTRGAHQMVKRLLAHGVEIDKRDGHGHTALRLAAANDDISTSQLLLSGGADPSEIDNGRVIPLLMTLMTTRW